MDVLNSLRRRCLPKTFILFIQNSITEKRRNAARRKELKEIWGSIFDKQNGLGDKKCNRKLLEYHE